MKRANLTLFSYFSSPLLLLSLPALDWVATSCPQAPALAVPALGEGGPESEVRTVYQPNLTLHP